MSESSVCLLTLFGQQRHFQTLVCQLHTVRERPDHPPFLSSTSQRQLLTSLENWTVSSQRSAKLLEAQYFWSDFQKIMWQIINWLKFSQPFCQISPEFCPHEHFTNIQLIITPILSNLIFRQRKTFYKTKSCYCFPKYCLLLWMLLWGFNFCCKSCPLLLLFLSE